ncbi:MAG TPA: DUF3887 domain-containing protein [Anaerolineaceae bacterium]
MMLSQKNKTILILFTILLLSLSTGCSQSRLLTGSEREQVLKIAEPYTDGILQGYNQNDYTQFSANFDNAMKKSLNQENFQALYQSFTAKIGKFESRQVTSVQATGTYFAINYLAKFEKEEKVSVRVVITNNEPFLVTGLWFDSPALRSR